MSSVPFGAACSWHIFLEHTKSGPSGYRPSLGTLLGSLVPWKTVHFALRRHSGSTQTHRHTQTHADTHTHTHTTPCYFVIVTVPSVELGLNKFLLDDSDIDCF